LINKWFNTENNFSGALDESGLIERMALNTIQDREICCYSISCKEKDNIDITLQWLISHSKSGGSAAGNSSSNAGAAAAQ